jgi:hypothetical protein
MSEELLDSENRHTKRPRDAAIDIDLYCLECGYNLRGLSGDPVRCPECAYRNPIGETEVPADQITKQLRRMETAPATSVLSLLLFAPLLGVLVLGLYSGGPSWYSRVNVCFGAATFIAGVMWVVGIARFRAHCMAQPGWVTVLARYHCVALVLAAVVVEAFVVAAQIVAASAGPLHTQRGGSTFCLAMPLTFVVVVVGVRWGLKPVHRWLKTPMEQLQRKVAVEIARDRIRRELRHKARTGLWSP